MTMPTTARDALAAATTTPRHEMTDAEYDEHERREFEAYEADWLAQFTNGFYVNTYEIDRAYGGPEEGGWWFDTGSIVKSVRCDTQDEAEAMTDRRRLAHPNTGDASSVTYRGGEYRTRIEPVRGIDYPEHRPHYE